MENKRYFYTRVCMYLNNASKDAVSALRRDLYSFYFPRINQIEHFSSATRSFAAPESEMEEPPLLERKHSLQSEREIVIHYITFER